MNLCWASFLFLFSVSYCFGRYTGRWILTKDEDLIDSSLKKALAHVNITGDWKELLLKVSNVVCKRKLFNGVNIKLYFDIDQSRWKCSLYKPMVQTFDMNFENCTQISDEDSSDEIDPVAAGFVTVSESRKFSDDDHNVHSQRHKISKVEKKAVKEKGKALRNESRLNSSVSLYQINEEDKPSQDFEQTGSQDKDVPSEEDNGETMDQDENDTEREEAKETADEQEQVDFDQDENNNEPEDDEVQETKANDEENIDKKGENEQADRDTSGAEGNNGENSKDEEQQDNKIQEGTNNADEIKRQPDDEITVGRQNDDEAQKNSQDLDEGQTDNEPKDERGASEKESELKENRTATEQQSSGKQMDGLNPHEKQFRNEPKTVEQQGKEEQDDEVVSNHESNNENQKIEMVGEQNREEHSTNVEIIASTVKTTGTTKTGEKNNNGTTPSHEQKIRQQ